MAVDTGAGNASVSYPWLIEPAGYGVLYIDDRDTSYFRNIPPGYNDSLKISPGVWPPGYRVPNGQVGGGYPSGSAKGTEPILIMPPPKGTGRVQFHSMAKVTVTNPSNNQRGSFTCGIGVGYVNGPNRPMFPYLGAAHDMEPRDMRPETIGAGDTRSATMFRTDFIDNTMNGGASNFPDWPNWEMTPNADTKMYPALVIVFMNRGQVSLQVGNVYAYGWVS